MEFARQCLASGEAVSLTSTAPAYWLSLESYCEDALHVSDAVLEPRANTDQRWRRVYLPMLESGELSHEAALVMRSAAARSERVPGLFWPCVVSVMLADYLQMPSGIAWHVQRYASELDYLRAVQWTRRIISARFDPQKLSPQPAEAIPVADFDDDHESAGTARITLRHNGSRIVDAEPLTRDYWRQLAQHCSGYATDHRTRCRDPVPGLYLSYAAGVALWAAGCSHGHIARAMPADRSRWALRYRVAGSGDSAVGPIPLAPNFSAMARGQVSRAIRSTAQRLAILGGLVDDIAHAA